MTSYNNEKMTKATVRKAIEEVVEDYNMRPHSSLFYLTPNEVFSDTNLQNKVYNYYHILNQDKL